MASEYINVPLNTSLKGWNSRWFYIKQSHPLIRCDVHYIPVNHSNWSERPNNAEMEQVMELLELSKGLELRGELVAASFIVRRIQPCKERAHLAFDYKGDNDGTRENTDRLTKKEVIDRAMDLFTSNVLFNWPKGTKAFNCTNPPPQVTISLCVYQAIIAEHSTDSLMTRFIRRIGQYTFQTCREPIGQKEWILGGHCSMEKVSRAPRRIVHPQCQRRSAGRDR